MRCQRITVCVWQRERDELQVPGSSKGSSRRTNWHKGFCAILPLIKVRPCWTRGRFSQTFHIRRSFMFFLPRVKTGWGLWATLAHKRDYFSGFEEDAQEHFGVNQSVNLSLFMEHFSYTRRSPLSVLCKTETESKDKQTTKQQRRKHYELNNGKAW